MSFGGKFNYAKEYAKYKPNQPDSIFEKYVEKTPDLLAAWNQIKDDPTGTQGSYWKPRGATSKAAFGRAHAAESGALKSGTYHGGTDVKPSSGKTRFETFMDTLSKGKVKDNGEEVPYGTYTGDNPYYPVLDTAYSAPEVPNWAEGGGGLIPDSYAPWSQASTEYIPQNIWEGNPLQKGLGKGITYSPPPTGLLTIPQDSGSKTSGKTITDTSGNKWVMAPGGSFIPAGSDYATALAAGNALDPNMYDQNGAFIGAEGQSIFATMQHKFNPATGNFEMTKVPGSGAVSINKFLDPTSALAQSGFFDSAIGVDPNMTQEEYDSAHASVVDAINAQAGVLP